MNKVKLHFALMSLIISVTFVIIVMNMKGFSWKELDSEVVQLIFITIFLSSSLFICSFVENSYRNLRFSSILYLILLYIVFAKLKESRGDFDFGLATFILFMPILLASSSYFAKTLRN